MERIEKTIEADVPVSTAYNQWTQFEEFPRFMEGVEAVTQLDDERLYWVASIAGQRKEWEARIVEQVPDQHIIWESETGFPTRGMISFRPVDSNRTRVTLSMDYEPENLVDTVGDKLGFVNRRVQGDLDRFKEFIEARGVETGAWRGTIR